MLPKVIEFGANAEGAAVLAAMQTLPDVLAYRSRLPAPLVPARTIEHSMVNGPWKRLVFGHPAHDDGVVNRHAYIFCVLEQFYRHLKRREIYADSSTKWRNPQAQLLEGPAWEAVRGEVLTTLGLPDDPDAHLAGHAQTLDQAYREVGGRLVANTEVRVDDDGKIHLSGVKAVEEPPSLVDLRARTTAMQPRVDLPEVILEVMSWEPAVAEAFTAVSGGRSRLEDLPTSIAVCLAAHSMNVGYRPIAKKGVPALERSRLSHVFQNYFRPETLAPANAPLVAGQADLPLAQAWGGGLVAAVDGMRFIVPVPAAFARPNRKFFGSKRGPARPERLADQRRGRLRAAEHLRPREDRPEEGPPELGRDPAGSRLHLHRHRPRIRRGGNHAPTRRVPHRAERGHRRLRPDLQVPAHPRLHRHRRDLPPRHQAHPQPAGRPPRPGPQDLPRPQG
jgi:hypothetical protein